MLACQSPCPPIVSSHFPSHSRIFCEFLDKNHTLRSNFYRCIFSNSPRQTASGAATHRHRLPSRMLVTTVLHMPYPRYSHRWSPLPRLRMPLFGHIPDISTLDQNAMFSLEKPIFFTTLECVLCLVRRLRCFKIAVDYYLCSLLPLLEKFKSIV